MRRRPVQPRKWPKSLVYLVVAFLAGKAIGDPSIVPLLREVIFEIFSNRP